MREQNITESEAQKMEARAEAMLLRAWVLHLCLTWTHTKSVEVGSPLLWKQKKGDVQFPRPYFPRQVYTSAHVWWRTGVRGPKGNNSSFCSSFLFFLLYSGVIVLFIVFLLPLLRLLPVVFLFPFSLFYQFLRLRRMVKDYIFVVQKYIPQHTSHETKTRLHNTDVPLASHLECLRKEEIQTRKGDSRVY